MDALALGDKKGYARAKSEYDEARGYANALADSLKPDDDAVGATPAVGWFAFPDRKPSGNGFYLVYGNCTGGVMPSQDIAEYDAGEQKFLKHNQPKYWRHLPPPPPNA